MPKILLVEDDNNLREIFELRLIAEGYKTVTAGNGEEALVIAMKERPDLIIADVMMPKLSGFEMLETLRAAPEMADTKTIMMTALGQAEDRARGESLGVIKYLVKSQVTLEDFVRVVRGVIAPDDTTVGGPAAAAPANSQLQNNPESERSMQEDNATAPTDSGAPTPNPINDAGSAPVGQASTAQEQSAVQDKINDFVSSTPADAPAAGQPVSEGDAPASPAPESAPMGDVAATDASPAPLPPTTPPAESAPQPPVESGDGSVSPANNTL